MLHLLLALGIIGLITSTIYAALVVAGVVHFRRQRVAASPDFAPPVSLLKPVHGAEPNLAEHLDGFFRQDYPAYEILFCARSQHDAGLVTARQVAARYPQVPVQFLTTGEPPFANAKVASLERMAQAARHGILVVSDSDVRVTPGYLRQVIAPFADAEVGLVTCPYRGVPSPAHHERGQRGAALWAMLEGVGMSIEMTAGVLVANLLEGMQFALGPTMAVRSECVRQIGGFQAMGQYCADDFLLGNRVAALGRRVIFSHHAIDHMVLNTGFVDSIRHQVRWSKSTRFSRPKGHFGTSLTFSMPFALIAAVAAVCLHWPWLAAGFLTWGVGTRMLLAGIVGSAVVQERSLWRTMLLFPLRDLMGFGFWLASYGSNKILWRGQEYRLDTGGYMRSEHGAVVLPNGERAERESALTV